MLNTGATISVISMFIVFFGMSLLVLCISLMLIWSERRKHKRIVKTKGEEVSKQDVKIPADVSIAIAMALYFNRFISEEKQHKITIQKSTMPFSPWLNRARNSTVVRTISAFSRRSK